MGVYLGEDEIGVVVPAEEGQCRIRWIDYDGTILDTEYVDIGSPLPTYAAPTPSDSRLTFVKWVTQTSDTTVTRDLDFGAIYKCNVEKTIGSTIVNPTILDCNFNSSTGLSPTIPIAPTSEHTVYIDWGDGSTIDEVTSTTTISHTYASAGNYSIQVYSDATWGFSTSSSIYLLGSRVYNKALLRAIIGSEMVRLYSYAFRQCYSLQSIIIPDTVTSISGSAFQLCCSLQSIIIPDTITSINDSAIASCYGLQSIVIPNNITSIGSTAFYQCYSLQSIIIPDTVTSIKSYAFRQCYCLQSIVIPDTVTSISEAVFYQCYGLQSIIIPNTMTSIGSYAFQQCSGLQSIVIPDIATSINSYAFYQCYSLQSIIIPLNWSQNIDFIPQCYSLTEETLISIANRIADLSGSTVQTITLTTSNQILMMRIFVDANGNRVPEGTVGAKNLVEFITDKNWTIATLD